LRRLEEYEGPPEIMEIAALIKAEFLSRYTGYAPEAVAVAVYFSPEAAYAMWEKGEWSWDNTRAKDASKWVVKHLTAHFEPEPPTFPPPIMLMEDGPAKDGAVANFTASDAAAQKKEFKKTVEAEFTDLLKRLGSDVFNSRQAFKKAKAEYEAALKAFEAAGAGTGDGDGDGDGADAVAAPPAIKPTKPEYAPIDTLKWWRANKRFFKFLAPVARLLLSIQISSAEVERLFSRGGIVLTPRRNRLGSEKREKFLVVGYNVSADWNLALKAGVEGAEQRVALKNFYNGCSGGLDFDDDEQDNE